MHFAKSTLTFTLKEGMIYIYVDNHDFMSSSKLLWAINLNKNAWSPAITLLFGKIYYVLFCITLPSQVFPSEAEINTLSSYGSRYSRVFFSPYNPWGCAVEQFQVDADDSFIFQCLQRITNWIWFVFSHRVNDQNECEK